MAALRALLQSTLAVTETGLCVLPASAALSPMSLLSIMWWLCCGLVGCGAEPLSLLGIPS